MKVMPTARCSRLSSNCIAWRSSWSRAASGSSSSSTWGPTATARGGGTRWRGPPDNRRGERPPRVTPSTAATTPKRLGTSRRSTPAAISLSGSPEAARWRETAAGARLTSFARRSVTDPEAELLPEPERDDGADDREDEAGGMELAVSRLPDQAGDEAADDRADDAKHDSPEDAHLGAMDDGAGDESGDQAYDQGPDHVKTSHARLLSWWTGETRLRCCMPDPRIGATRTARQGGLSRAG